MPGIATRKTHAAIEFGLMDVSAKEDSTLAVSDRQSFADIEQLEQDGLDFPKYASLEKNRWTLDGSFSLLPDGPASVGWWSMEMSGADGVMSVPPVLTANFSKQHSSIGITFTFLYEDWASEINVKWYNGETLLAEKTDRPNATVYAVLKAVENYNKIVVTFFKTSKPYRYVHLTRVDYGVTRVFGENEIMSANLEEEIDPLSETVTINTLGFKLHSTDAEFSIINPQGIYQFLQQRQKMLLYEYVNTDKRFMGAYYLSQWSGENENTFSMKTIDAIGLMDGSQFSGGMYANKTAQALLEDIVRDAGFVLTGTGEVLLSVDPAIAAIQLTGHLPICSHREAIQQVAFALGAVVDTSRTDRILVYRASYAPVSTVERSRKFTGQTVDLDILVTGVEVTEHTYTVNAAVENVFEGDLSAGDNFVKFSDPATGLSVIGGTLITSHVNYAVVQVAAAQKVTVTGKKYTDNKKVVGVYMANLPAGQTAKILPVEDATLVSRSNAQAVAQWVFDLHQKRIVQNFSFAQDLEQVGKSYDVETLYEQTKSGLLTQLQTDLTKGFTGKAVVVGG